MIIKTFKGHIYLLLGPNLRVYIKLLLRYIAIIQEHKAINSIHMCVKGVYKAVPRTRGYVKIVHNAGTRINRYVLMLYKAAARTNISVKRE